MTFLTCYHHRLFQVVLVIILTVYSPGGFVVGQSLEEIDQELALIANSAPSIAHIHRIFALAEILIDSAQYDELISLYTSTLKASRAIKYLQGEHLSLSQLAYEYSQIGEYGSTVLYGDSLLREDQVPDSLRKATLLLKGISLTVMGDYKKAIESLEEAVDIPIQLVDEMEIYDYLSYSYSGLGIFDKAVAYCLEALEKLEKEEVPQYEYLSQFHHNLALIRLKNNEYEEAIEAYQKALAFNIEFEEKGKDHPSIQNVVGYAKSKRIPILIEASDVFHHLQRSDTAKQMLIKARSLAHEGGRNKEIRAAVIGMSLANLYNEVRAYDSASLELDQVESYFIGGKLQEYSEHVTYLLTRGSTQLGLRQFEKALTTLSMAEEVARKLEVEDESILYDLHQSLSTAYEEVGDFKNALIHFRRADILQDSIYNTEKAQVIQELEIQYQTIQQEQQIMAFQRNEERLQNQLNLAFMGGAVLILLGGVGFWFYRVKSQDNRILAQKNQEIHSLSKFKQWMTHMIAHDLKNLLSIVLNGLNSHEQAQPSITQAAYFANQLVSNMLDIQKFEDAQMKLNIKSHRLIDLVREAQVQLEYLMSNKRITLILQLEEHVVLQVDRDLVVRTFINLLHNAIKYSGFGQEIELSSQLDYSQDRPKVIFGIKDYGQGIKSEELAHIFDPYWHTTKIEQGMTKSTGLGLTFCKWVMEAHGGSIGVQSQRNKYTQLSLTFENADLRPDSKREEVPALAENGNEKLLTQLEKETIIEHAPELKSLKVYQSTQLRQVLGKLEELPINEAWKKEIEFAIHECDEGTFESVLAQLQ